MIEPI
jgi:glycerophosphoryl diester phosphodiesterase